MEGHFRREVFLDSAYQIELISLRQLNDLSMPNNKVTVENIFLVF